MAEAERVLLIAGQLTASASSRATVSLAKELHRYGMDLRVVCAPGPFASDIARYDIPTHVLKVLSWPSLIGFAYGRILDVISEFQPDIIHLQSQSLVKLGARLSKNAEGAYVITFHMGEQSRRRGKVINRCYRGVVAVSEAVRESLVNDARIAKELIRVIPNGVDTKKYGAQLFRKPGNSTPVVGCVGSLEATNGHEYLIRAARIVLNAGYSAQFVICGDGPEEPHLRDLCSELELHEHVTFASCTADHHELLSTIDILAMPYLQESLDYVLLEAMAMGKPVVASDVGGVYTMVKECETGLLVPPGDEGAVAAALIELLSHPAMVEEFGCQGQQYVREHFNLSRIVETTAQFYRDIVSS